MPTNRPPKIRDPSPLTLFRIPTRHNPAVGITSVTAARGSDDVVVQRCARLAAETASVSSSDAVNTRSLCPVRNSAPSYAPPTAPPSTHAAPPSPARYAPDGSRSRSSGDRLRSRASHHGRTPRPASPAHNGIRPESSPPLPQTAVFRARGSSPAGSPRRRQLRHVARQRVAHLNRRGSSAARCFSTSARFSPACCRPVKYSAIFRSCCQSRRSRW